jgi:hypothetical protein
MIHIMFIMKGTSHTTTRFCQAELGPSPNSKLPKDMIRIVFIMKGTSHLTNWFWKVELGPTPNSKRKYIAEFFSAPYNSPIKLDLQSIPSWQVDSFLCHESFQFGVLSMISHFKYFLTSIYHKILLVLLLMQVYVAPLSNGIRLLDFNSPRSVDRR